MRNPVARSVSDRSPSTRVKYCGHVLEFISIERAVVEPHDGFASYGRRSLVVVDDRMIACQPKSKAGVEVGEVRRWSIIGVRLGWPSECSAQ